MARPKKTNLDLPLIGHNCDKPADTKVGEWWTIWVSENNPTTVARNRVDSELRQQIYAENYGIRIGIARSLNENQKLVFAHTQEPEVAATEGIRIGDGVNVLDGNFIDLIETTHLTITKRVLCAILDGCYGHYTFELSDAAKQAFSRYLQQFSEYEVPQQFVRGAINPVEQYNRFDEIEALYPNLETAAKAQSISNAQMLRKLNVFDADSRTQFRYALPQQSTKNHTPLEQWKDGEIVNKFTTLEEAAKLLGVGKSTVSRWVISGQEDNFGCTWVRNKNCG